MQSSLSNEIDRRNIDALRIRGPSQRAINIKAMQPLLSSAEAAKKRTSASEQKSVSKMILNNAAERTVSRFVWNLGHFV